MNYKSGVAPIVVIIILIMGGLGYFAYTKYGIQKKLPYTEGEEITVEGSLACLGHKKTLLDRIFNRAETLECRMGLTTTNGIIFELSWPSYEPKVDKPLLGSRRQFIGIFSNTDPASRYAADGELEIKSVITITP